MVTMICAILVLLALGAFLLSLRYVVKFTCPECINEQPGVEGDLIPVIPGVRWACLSCGASLKTGELIVRKGHKQRDVDDDDDQYEVVDSRPSF
jgi:predicted RNA-binding Zn-ribbon protein involved in translation (DUF1610 family)